MVDRGFTPQHRLAGRVAALGVFVLGVLYASVTAIGLLSLDSPDDPIGDPWFTIMELLIIVIAPLMLVAMVAVHGYASPGSKIYAAIAAVFMALMAGITSCLHFVILTTGGAIEDTSPELAPLLISFEWPSVVYALDILAWDWFFALSMLSAALVFNAGGLEKALRILMLVSGVLSLAGLIGVPLADMQYRNIGIIGYGVVAPVAFLIMGIVFGRAPSPAAIP
jgi:hypothetical protein